MKRTYWLALAAVVLLLAGPLAAQDQPTTFLSLQIDDTNLQTGQFYEVTILLENVTDFWLIDADITYDPERLYISGTESGSPVRGGDVWAEGPAVRVFNRVEDDTLRFSASLVNPAEPFDGTGTLGTFVIYPLSAGTVQLAFPRAEMRAVQFEDTDEGRLPVGPPQVIEFAPVLLELTITGDTVEPPPEATATPTPTATATEIELTSAPTATLEPTRVNITRAPATTTVEATAEPSAEQPEAADTASPLIPILIAVMVVSVVGLAVLLVLSRRRA